MGVGAIVMLAVLAVLTLGKANRFLETGDTVGAVLSGVMFALEVAVLVVGNPWVWATWVLIGAAKMIFLPSPEIAEAARRMPPWVHNVNIAASVAFSGCVFALFQHLR